jgi:hypothetical protein
MNIFRVADEKVLPTWFDKEQSPETSPIEEVESVNIAKEITEEVLAQECERIDACSSNGKIYHYNSTWDKSVVSHLREYAIACGMELGKFKGFDPTDIQRTSKSENIVKTASVATQEEINLKEIIGDPFHISQRSDMSHMVKSNWQEVKKQANLNDPSVDSGSVISLRGGENYFLNSDVNPAINQNSITNPDAIRQLAESTKEDNGERLKKQKAQKETDKIANNKAWEKEKIDEMVKIDIVPRGNVFPTETLNANNGLSNPSSKMGVYAKFDVNSIPDMTKGEKLKQSNKEYKESIQRKSQKDDWQKPSKQSSRSISDNFGASLAELLGKQIK